MESLANEGTDGSGDTSEQALSRSPATKSRHRAVRMGPS